ncbi:hypothetical protein AB0G04_41515 [Actinoplanes sp. NPDC023801]|uniref:hypothetical protein n=1 Tax=Actinoplanes sp. NPDC023801 TaxID=3154595 RepID=UPI0033D61D4F
MALKRFLVLQDYGMGGLWWWIHARSEREIMETFAGVEVVGDPEDVARFADGSLDEVDIDDPVMPAGLKEARKNRDAQRDRPGFGALAGRERVWIRDPYEDEVYLEELGPDGRRLRQVTIEADGTMVRTGPEDWPFNPPRDLYDPELLRYEISADEFERAWNAA